MGNIEEIKSRADIVDVIGKVVSLKKTGSNYKGLCPFHSEKTPSFIVNEQRQYFTCFGCGAKGDVLEFVQRYYGLDFREAMEQLADQYGVILEQTYSGESLDPLYEINHMAADYYYKNLRKGPGPGLSYAASRELTKETLRDFGIGYAGDDWQGLYSYLKGKGCKDKDLLRLGLVSQSGDRIYDRFRGRLMFPILNTRGKVIGFGGRILGKGEPKYLNSSESSVFQKKNNLYGLNQARETITREDRAIIVEGYMDVISLHQAGVKNAVASLGTALTENQANLLKRYTKNVVLCYDSDDAGVAAAMRGMDVLQSQGLNVRVTHVTDGKDPDDFIKSKGQDAFRELIDRALPFADYKFAHYAKRYDLSDIQGRVGFMEQAVKVLQQLKPVEADMYVQQLARTYDISPEAIRREMGQAPKTGAHRPERPRQEARQGVAPAEQALLKLILTDSAYMERPELTEELFTTEEGRILFGAVKEVYQKGKAISAEEAQDLLGDVQRQKLKELAESTVLGADHEAYFMDCIAKARDRIRKQQEQELLQQIALAEGEGNGALAGQLTKELIQLQQEIQLGGNHGNH